MKAIYLREIRSYFTGMIGWIFIAAMLLIVGVYAYVLNFVQKYPTFESTLYLANFAYLIVIPILTMRTFSEERRSRTSELLYSLPLKASGIVLGKYLALLTVLAVPCLLFCLYPLVLSRFGNVEMLTSFGSIFAFFLLGAAMSAIGMFLSSLTSNQIASAILIFVASFICYLAADIVTYIPTTAYASFTAFLVTFLAAAVIVYILTKSITFSAIFAIVSELILTILYFVKGSVFSGTFPRFVGAFAVFSKFDRFASGIFDLGAVGYYITVSALFLFFCTLSLEKRRWSL